MTDQQPGGGGGFTPLTPLGGPSLEQEERAMKAGRGRMMFAMIVAVLAAIAGLAWFVARQQPNPYGALGRAINGMRGEHFDAFWACALPRADLRDIDRADQLIGEIAERSATPRAYAQHVRNECLVRLDEHVAPMSQLIIPDDLRASYEQLRAAVEALRTAWGRYLEHLERLEGPFDAEDEATNGLLTAIARGWYDYKTAHGALNTTIRSHVDDE